MQNIEDTLYCLFLKKAPTFLVSVPLFILSPSPSLSKCHLLFIKLYRIILLFLPSTRFRMKAIKNTSMSTILILFPWRLLPPLNTYLVPGIVLGTHHTWSHLILIKPNRGFLAEKKMRPPSSLLNYYSILPVSYHL